MIDSNHTTCDVCGAAKGATNHWLVAMQIENHSGIMFVPADEATPQRDAPAMKISDLCGAACAVKRFSQFLATLTTLAPGTPTPKGSSE